MAIRPGRTLWWLLSAKLWIYLQARKRIKSLKESVTWIFSSQRATLATKRIAKSSTFLTESSTMSARLPPSRTQKWCSQAFSKKLVQGQILIATLEWYDSIKMEWWLSQQPPTAHLQLPTSTRCQNSSSLSAPSSNSACKKSRTRLRSNSSSNSSLSIFLKTSKMMTCRSISQLNCKSRSLSLQ